MAVDLGVSEGLSALSNAIGRGSAVSNLLRAGSRKLTKVSKDAFAIPVANAGTPLLFNPGPVSSQQPQSVVSVTPSNWKPSAPSISTGANPEQGGGSVSGPKPSYDNLGNLLDTGLGQVKDNIGKEYDSEIKRLRAEENRINSVYGQALSQAQGYYPEFQKQVTDQQTATQNQITGLQDQRKMESERAMGQSRQLLNDLNRRQAAYMSATGTYGSAVPEAYGEQFGRKAFDSLSQIQGSRDQALNQLSQKSVEAKQFFDQKMLEGKQKYDSLITNLQMQLNAQLDQIGSAKGAAASAKRAASNDAWNNYVNNKFSLEQEMQNYQRQVTDYATTLTQDTGALSEQNPVASNNWGGPQQIDSSNNQNILPQMNYSAGQTNALSQQQAPVYTKRRLTPQEEQQYQMSGFGLQLNQ